MAADHLMETSPGQSPDSLDSRKRPREFDSDHVDPKRTHVKNTVPSVASGAIIGKGGETIAQLQKDTGTKVKMSKSADFYPGTTERVCLISGSVNAIMEVLDFIMEKIKEKPEIKAENENQKPQQERDKQVKILVPNTTAGMIIGKSGNYIKQIKEASGCYVQISQKSNEISLQERCITVIGEKEFSKKACLMILEKIVEDPSSGSCLNLSYADVSGPVANYNPTGSPFANSSSVSTPNPTTHAANTFAHPVQFSHQNGVKIDLNPSFNYGLALNNNLNLNLNVPPIQNVNPTPLAQILEHIQILRLSLRTCGYSDVSSNEICSALSTLAKYGLLGFNIGLSAPTPIGLTNFLGVALEPAIASSPAASNLFGSIGQLSIGTTSPSQHQRAILDRIENTFEHFRPQSTTDAKLLPIHNSNNNNNNNTINQNHNSNSYGLGISEQIAKNFGTNAVAVSNLTSACKSSKNSEMPEAIVGTIIGCFDPPTSLWSNYNI